MGIEPNRPIFTRLENKRFGAAERPKCDERVNFHVGPRRNA
jgi:hypothetical protein